MKYINLGSIGKNLTLLVILAVLPALATILYSGLEQRRHSIENAKRDVLFFIRTVNEVQKRITNSTRQILSTLAHMPEVRNMDSQGSSEIFRAVIAQNPDYLNIMAMDINGEVFASALPFTKSNLADRKHFREALANKGFAAGEYVVTRVGTFHAFTFAYPVLDNQGNLKAVLNIALKVERFAHFFDVAQFPENSFLAVTDHKGIRLFYYPSNEDTNPIGQPILSKAWERVQKAQGEGISIHHSSDGVRRIIAFQQVRLGPDEEPYMYIWAGIPEAQVFKPANAILARNLMLMLFATLMALIVSWVIGKNTLILPMKRILTTTQIFARGNFHVRSELSDQPGELGNLAKAFDDMANALSESQEMLRTIADYTYDWEYWLLPDGVLQWVSPSCKRITGYTASEFMADQKLMHRIVYQEDLSLFKQHLEKIETGEEHSSDLDFRIIHRSGQIVWINHHCILISRPDGTSLGRRVSNRDITERKMMEKEQEKLQAQLMQAQKMEAVGRLAGGVAHDFNNMLGVILGHAEMAIDQVDFSHPLHEDLLEIQKAALRSADLTRQLLAFARKQTISPQFLNLNNTISGMLKMLRRLIGENIDLVWKPGANLWPVMMDPSQIDQILANLAVNTRDAIELAGNLTIATQNTVFDETYSSTHPGFMPGEYVLLAVSDNGCGMDKQVLDNLFEPFFTTKEVGKGTGLGLATIYGIVKQNNGFINVYSEPGDGTSFKIYLPRIQTSETVKIEANEPEPSCGAETVLLVEDEEAILRLGKMILEGYGYTVLVASSPTEALILAKEHQGPIHLLLTDVVMPGMNGKELKERITVIIPEIRVLFMSGYTADVIACHGVIEEDVQYLQKPFSVKTLAAKVREVLERKKSNN